MDQCSRGHQNERHIALRAPWAFTPPTQRQRSRAAPSIGSQSGSAAPVLTQVPSTRSRGLLNCRKCEVKVKVCSRSQTNSQTSMRARDDVRA